ncbi:aldehyde dehydrogenase family 3 member B1 isoform X3 [Dunckerocampus dactyliophorus]|uniref:aldehyde dehydrogenase family 3 member B1 isoform X3 n=1 Tax=Dunckerocampus dactyliophorus TaxID=161453 RepID=UPI0024074E0C|nr:aldehyde dehydrogenase family 3 member B1 isoform X3 [Dunckerocampus dactyliophorus]
MDTKKEIVDRLRLAFRSGITLSEQFRSAQLTKLMLMIKDNEKDIVNALHKDLGKPKFEAILAEIDMVVNEIHYAIDNLPSWMQADYVSKTLATKLDDCFVRREPLGVVLIIGTWNYPLQLLILPMVGAIAAGNCVIIKPSEVSAATDLLIAELIPKYLSQDCYAVVRGGADETMALLQNRFDHIFYTAPTVVVDVAKDDVLMQEEIFGPILPIVIVDSLEKGIDFVNDKEKPLALYVFSDETSVVKTVLQKTSSGGFCSNDGIIHISLPGLPFGGVGASGWGSYHGRWGFETFSHRRACMMRGWALERLNGLRYPPYRDDKLSWLRWTASPKTFCSLM